MSGSTSEHALTEAPRGERGASRPASSGLYGAEAVRFDWSRELRGGGLLFCCLLSAFAVAVVVTVADDRAVETTGPETLIHRTIHQTPRVYDLTARGTIDTRRLHVLERLILLRLDRGPGAVLDVLVAGGQRTVSLGVDLCLFEHPLASLALVDPASHVATAVAASVGAD